MKGGAETQYVDAMCLACFCKLGLGSVVEAGWFGNGAVDLFPDKLVVYSLIES